jgi:signal transduction histidine kinase
MPRILHIEDDPANRLLVRKLLRGEGYEVIDAADGLEGVKLACASPPDLVLVDLNIPSLDGFEVTLRLRSEASLKGVPIVAITAEGDRDTSLAVGCDGFIQKPIDARGFAAVIAKYLKGAKERSAAPDDTLLREQSQRIVGHLEEKVAELSAANDRLRELSAARTEFYRNISHEIATPLTPIVGYVKLLAGGELGPVSAAQAKALAAMEKSIHRLRSTLDNLVDVTSLETDRFLFLRRDFDFAGVVRLSVDKWRPRAAERDIAIVAEGLDQAMPGQGDPERLSRAIGHLVENAIKFTPAGGVVGVAVRGTPDACAVVVADSGPGIPSDKLERIFDAFYQVDGSDTREHGGVGVGLAIARRTARGLGGDITVESPCDERIGGEALRGASFSLRIARHGPEGSA